MGSQNNKKMENKNRNFCNRKPNRLSGYYYAESNYYFITICTHNQQHWFGEVLRNQMNLNKYGIIVRKHWNNLPRHYPNCTLDQFVVMPNHLHGILIIDYCRLVKPSEISISEIIRGFKTFSSRTINIKSEIHFAWQRSFYDHIIRNERSLYEIRTYINNNPLQWDLDKIHCENI